MTRISMNMILCVFQHDEIFGATDTSMLAITSNSASQGTEPRKSWAYTLDDRQLKNTTR